MVCACATETDSVVAKQFGAASYVKVNVALPWLIPVTRPLLVTLATDGLLLTQVPSETGESWVVVPVQIAVGPVTIATGVGATVTDKLLGAVTVRSRAGGFAPANPSKK